MVTRCTHALHNQLAAIGEDSAGWADFFDDWKARGPAGEYDNYFFGKDGAYVGIKMDAPHVKLMHVHLVPILDPVALARWERDWARRSRKVSDRALIYADDGHGNYLLIYVLDEPSAHAIAKMATQQDRETMQAFAAVASAFVFDGSIIA